jgi:hypothetical protein
VSLLMLAAAVPAFAQGQAPARPQPTQQVPPPPVRAPIGAQALPPLPFSGPSPKATLPAASTERPSSPPATAEPRTTGAPADAVEESIPAPTSAIPRASAQRGLKELPLDSGLPLVVRAGLAFVDVEEIDENKQTFTGTADLRLSWLDLRLRYPAAEVPIGYREWRGEAATARLASIWHPEIGVANMRGEATRQSWSLRLYPDGRAELLRRVAASFGSPLDVQRFPFDRQRLQVELVSQDETADKVILDYRQDDLLFSRADPGIAISGWTVGAVNLTRDPLAGWYGESYTRLRVGLDVDRKAMETVPALFVPLLASLLIPLLAIWLNRSVNGEFEVKAFELTNIVIGGLFAIIALNFTINSERSILASSANTVSLLFGLNYLALAGALVINICLFRFNVVRAIAGRHVQHEVARFITWALPIAIAATAVALILIAAA